MKFLAVFLLLCGPAYAQSTCGDRASIVANLTTKFGEAHIGGGLQSATEMVEIWANARTKTFTILLTRVNGISCVVSGGNSWDSVDPQETLTFPM